MEDEPRADVETNDDFSEEDDKSDDALASPPEQLHNSTPLPRGAGGIGFT